MENQVQEEQDREVASSGWERTFNCTQRGMTKTRTPRGHQAGHESSVKQGFPWFVKKQARHPSTGPGVRTVDNTKVPCRSLYSAVRLAFE